MVVKTPSGYEVYLKDFLSFGQKRELKKLLYNKINTKVSTDAKGEPKADIEEFNIGFMQELQDKAFEMLIEKIVIDKVEHKDNLYKLVMDWKEADGQIVFDKIDEITAVFKATKTEVTAEVGKKKEA